MCGICGVAYADRSRPIDPEVLQGMTDCMVHRGPDSEGTFREGGIGLGVRRLSIIDLETGDQPISNEDGSITVVCNGEIYNYLELQQELAEAGHELRTKSDVEVIAHLYEDLGTECVHRLRGMFGFALWDANRGRLFIARDRIGIKPLYYSVDADGLVFGSEIQAILASGRAERRFDPLALDDLFTWSFIRSPKTFFASIRKLPPAHYATYESGELTIRRYWDIDFPERGTVPRRSPKEWAEILREKLVESVQIHMRSDVPLGAWVSGGVDSSGIAAMMTRETDQPVDIFSVAFENPRLDEVRQVRMLHEFPGYNVRPHTVEYLDSHIGMLPQSVWYRGEPTVGGIMIARMLVSELALGKVKVVLTGEGADELFGGYPWYWMERVLWPIRYVVPNRLRRRAMPRIARSNPQWRHKSLTMLDAPRKVGPIRYANHVGPGYWRGRRDVFSEDVRRRIAEDDPPIVDDELERRMKDWDSFQRLQYLDLTTRLPDGIMNTVDHGSMAYSLETRLPIMDHELIELGLRIPSRIKLRWREKAVLRNAMREYLPDEIAYRRKRGLRGPPSQWMRRDLPEYVLEMMSERKLLEAGYFDPPVVDELLQKHRSGEEYYGIQLVGVLMVQLWDDMFIRNPLDQAPAFIE